MSRSDQLKTVAEEFCRIHDEWAGDRKRPSPDGAYWKAVDDLTGSFADGDIPEDSRELAEAVQAFALHVQEFDDRDEPDDNPDPPNAFWAAREKIAKILQGQTRSAALKPLESIPSLRQLPGMSDMQIAKIYGLKDRYGNWLPHLVQQELDHPGSVLKTPGAVDGRNWVDPRLPPPGNEKAKVVATKIGEKRKKEAKPCPETPQELWEQGVSVSQAAKMLLKEESEVATLFAQFDQEREDAIESGEVVTAQTQHIRELTLTGLKPKAIAKQLGIDAKTVAKALEGWSPETAAAE
jgi:predicted RNase H-like HicB family nuclease